MVEEVPSWAWQKLVEANGDPMVVGRGPDGRILYANPAAQKLYGLTLEEFQTWTGRRLHPPEDGHIVTACDRELERCGHFRVDRIRLACATGELRWGSVQVALTRMPEGVGSIWISIIQDITAHVMAEQQRIEHVERLTTIGRLAAGVAHEINNPSTFILTNLHTVREELASMPATATLQEEWAELLADCIEGVQRITRITRELSDYSRIDRMVAGPCSLDDVVDEAVKLLGPEIRRHGRLVYLPGGLPPILIDRGRLQQVVVNLMMNARDAIQPGGTVTVRTCEVDGRHQIVVSDDGRGMDQETRQHIFAPFFTTKPSGKGTGLGLAVSWRIAQQHGGQILVDSSPGSGAVFILDLPALACEPSSAEVPTEAFIPVVRRARVLIVDDEVAILRSTARLLSADADVDLAASGAEALRYTRDNNYDLVLLDLAMPGMSGADVWAVMPPEVRGRTRFLTAGPATDEHAVLLDRVGWVAKPPSPNVLRALVADSVAVSNADSPVRQH